MKSVRGLDTQRPCWPEHASYDAIVVAAGGPELPKALVDQLSIGGRIVMPVDERRNEQFLIRVRKTSDGTIDEEQLGDLRFVPLIGQDGW